jgi:hypothetical protein
MSLLAISALFPQNEQTFWRSLLLFDMLLPREYLIHQAVGHRFLSRHVIIPFKILLDQLRSLSRVAGKPLNNEGLEPYNLAGLDAYVLACP